MEDITTVRKLLEKHKSLVEEQKEFESLLRNLLGEQWLGTPIQEMSKPIKYLFDKWRRLDTEISNFLTSKYTSY
jgi:hypothetical protein